MRTALLIGTVAAGVAWAWLRTLRRKRPLTRAELADEVYESFASFTTPDPELARELDAQVPLDANFGRFTDHG